jgi:hypothetical protein
MREEAEEEVHVFASDMVARKGTDVNPVVLVL